MLDPLARQIRTVAPSLLSDLKSAIAGAKRLMRKSRFWSWTKTEIRPEGAEYTILYSGTEERKDAALLALHRKAVDPALREASVAVSEFPIGQSLRVPQYLDMDVPLETPLDEILAGYGEKLRRVVLQQLPHAELTEARTAEDLKLADSAMLRPYAIERHGPTAAQIPPEQVARLSRFPYGRLHILRMNGEPVACHLGVHEVRKGRSYWTAVRFGYVESVFSNSKRLHEVNSTNVFLATKFAKEFGADFYSLGMSLGRPDDGLLHWKRRRGGVLNATTSNDWFYVRAPHNNVPTFFWGGPLFAMRGTRNRLSLHVGIPAGVDEASVAARYRETHFRGIEEVFIHHEVSTPHDLLEKTAALLTDGTGARLTYYRHTSSTRAKSAGEAAE
jgi:hypothetical protein